MSRALCAASVALWLGLTSGCATPQGVDFIKAPYGEAFRAAERAVEPAPIEVADPAKGVIATLSTVSFDDAMRQHIRKGLVRVRYRLRLWPVGERTAIEADVRVQRRTRLGRASIIWRTEPTPPAVIEVFLARVRREVSNR